MKANPGGNLKPEEVIGRDQTIREIWDILSRQSVVLTAERRMGKTQLFKKMVHEAPSGIVPVFRHVEGIRTRVEFVEAVLRDVEKHLSRWGRTCSKTRKVLSGLAGTEIGGVLRLPELAGPVWKDLLENTFEDLVEKQDSHQMVIFFWDEIPMMLYNIRHNESQRAAADLLDQLRRLRQTHNRLRMVFTGSIGLHHVIGDLHRADYSNDPTNDMHSLDLEPLKPTDGVRLAKALLRGEGILAEDDDKVAVCISHEVDHVPFYIHHVVYGLKTRVPSAAEVRALVSECLRDPQDRWHLDHYRWVWATTNRNRCARWSVSWSGTTILFATTGIVSNSGSL